MAAGAVSDPYALASTDAYPLGYYTLDGRTQVAAASALTTLTFIHIGQSLGGNNSSGSYSVVNAQNHNFCFRNGAVYQTLPRMLGCGDTLAGENFLARLADKIITAGSKQRIIMAPMAVDASAIADHASGGSLNARIGVMCRRLASVGLVPDAILFSIGESDAQLGTSQASFQAGITSVLSTFSAAGVTCTAYLEKCTWIAGAKPAGATAIRAAVDAVVNGTTIKAGPDTDTLDNTNRRDNTHWNATGADAAAGLWKTALGL